MLIGFFLDNSGVSQTDFSRPWEGSPGTGASEYVQVALPYFIAQYGGESIETCIFAPHTDLLPSDIHCYEAPSVIHAARKAKAAGVDYFVFRPRIHEETRILDVLDDLQLASIGISQLTPHPVHVRRLTKSKALKALVCVGREQYDYLMDAPIYKKLAYIDNGVQVSSCNDSPVPTKDHRLVAYMGALVPQKGFHVLAQAWPKVLQRFPDARLSVIGSAKVYNENALLGPLGIAHEKYESTQIIPYLSQPDGSLHPSVTFHGQLGKEKYDILRRALVGVANPTGQTETCCVSAVEMAACGTAVVSGAYYAMLDTVHHNKTGLLGRNIDDLAANICNLLDNPDHAVAMGAAGYSRTMAQYDFSVVAPKWVNLCNKLIQQKMPESIGKLKNISYQFKFLRMVNRIPQMIFGSYLPWPSLQEAAFFYYRVRRKYREG